MRSISHTIANKHESELNHHKAISNYINSPESSNAIFKVSEVGA